MSGLNIMAGAAAVLVAAVAAVVWTLSLRGGPARLTITRLGFTAITTGGTAAITCLLLALLVAGAGGRGWALRVVFWSLMLAPAVVGVCVLVQALRRSRGFARGFAITGALLGLLALPIGLYATLIEPYWLDVRRVDVPIAGWPPDAPPIRVAVLADIQTDQVGPYERGWIAATLAEKPDLIIMPGDFFHCWGTLFADRRPEFVALLRQLEAPLGVYACRGNIDPPERTQQLFRETGIRLLRDDVCVVNAPGVRLAVGGSDYRYWNSSDPPFLHQMRDVDADARLLMSHKPDAVLGARSGDMVDLIVSGHTHGGQVVIPGFGPPFTASRVPRAVAAGGVHQVEGQQIYVSRGIGMERIGVPPLRFFCRPELTILTLRPPAGH